MLPWNVIQLKAKSKKSKESKPVRLSSLNGLQTFDGIYPDCAIDTLTYGPSGTLFADDDRNDITYAWNVETTSYIGQFERPADNIPTRTPTTYETTYCFNGETFNIAPKKELNGFPNIETLEITDRENKSIASWTLPYDVTRKVPQDATTTLKMMLKILNQKDNAVSRTARSLLFLTLNNL